MPHLRERLSEHDAAGFARREIDPGDLRRHRIVLTTAGRKIMARGLARLSDAFGTRLALLTGAEQGQLKTLLEKMI